MSDWEITRSTGRCSASGRELAEGDAFYAVLFDRGESFERLDYAKDNWTGPPEGAFCVWRSKVPPREERKRRFVDDDVLMEFFERLDRESEESKVQFRFVLTLILMRKRLLKYLREDRDESGNWWVMRVMGPFKTGDESRDHRRVLDPEMDEDQIEQVSRQLGVILTGEFSRFEQTENSEESPQEQPVGPGDPDA